MCSTGLVSDREKIEAERVDQQLTFLLQVSACIHNQIISLRTGNSAVRELLGLSGLHEKESYII